MLIVGNVTETEADALCRIIEQQANEIVELQNKIRVFEQDLAYAKFELQGKAFLINTLSNDKSSFTSFVLRNELVTVWSWIEPAAKTITLYSKHQVKVNQVM